MSSASTLPPRWAAGRLVAWRVESLFGLADVDVRQPADECFELIAFRFIAPSRQASDDEPSTESVHEFGVHPQKMPHDADDGGEHCRQNDDKDHKPWRDTRR